MAERTPKSADAGEKEVQQAFDKAEEKGYFGVSPDPLPNEAYSLENGPPATNEEREELVRKAQS